MALGYIISGLVGLGVSVVVNLLADRLPLRALAARQDDNNGKDSSEVPEPVVAKRRWARYVIVTLLLIGFAIYLYAREQSVGMAVVLYFYVALFALIGVIDIEHRLVLNTVMLPVFFIAIIEVLVSGRFAWDELLEPFAGYAIAQIAVLGIYFLGELYLKFINRNRDEPVDEVAFGFGDVTLATFCGLVVGYPSVVLLLALMILFGALFAIIYVIVNLLIKRSYTAHAALPYGPAILLAATLMLLWGEAVARAFGAP